MDKQTMSYWRRLFQQDKEQYISELTQHLKQFADKAGGAALRSLLWQEGDLRALLSKSNPGSLGGVPFLVKDLFDVEGEVSGCSSRVMDQVGVSARADALLVRQFRSLGAIPVGRTHMNEFAYGLDGHNAYFGNCPNALDPHRISGGSSSGSAWAVGAGVVPLAFGTDTGGSIRVPASFNGIYGFRREVDLYGQRGVFPLAPRFDTVGWFTGTAGDMRTVISETVTKSADPVSRILWYAPESVELEKETLKAYDSVLSSLTKTGVTVDGAPTPAADPRRAQNAGAIADPNADRATPGHPGSANTIAAVEHLDDLAADAKNAYNVIGSTEAFQIHEGWIDLYKEAYDPAVWRLIDRSRHWPEGALEQADEVQQAIRNVFIDIWSRYQAVAMPAVFGPPPLHEDVDAEFRSRILQLSCYGSLAQAPALTVPVGIAGGLSAGIQFLFPRDFPGRALSVLDLIDGQ